MSADSYRKVRSITVLRHPLHLPQRVRQHLQIHQHRLNTHIHQPPTHHVNGYSIPNQRWAALCLNVWVPTLLPTVITANPCITTPFRRRLSNAVGLPIVVNITLLSATFWALLLRSYAVTGQRKPDGAESSVWRSVRRRLLNLAVIRRLRIEAVLYFKQPSEH